MYRFAHISFLYLLLLIPVFTGILAWFLWWRKKALRAFGNPAVIGQLMPESSSGKLVFKFILAMLAYALLVVAMAQPQTGSRLEKVHRKGIDLMIALDVSNSMLAQDIRPNRLERSKQAISRLIDQLEGDRIGIIVFAGKAYTQLPITTDYAAAKLFLSTISTNSVPVQGTAIGDAIALADTSFGQSNHSKAIIVITDGEDHEGDVLEQAESAAKKGIVIYTIGMGEAEGAPIPVYTGNLITGYKKDRQGVTIISKLDETLLQRIASIGNGMYVRASNSDAGLQGILDNLNRMQKSEIEARQFSDYEDRFQYFVALALILLAIDVFVYDRKNQWFKNFKPF
ncbi:MAG TPA: VWA domain-containing protein [Bacteroidales bacterium]|nr:VWA domain-containing protein [Bacteroidales bacterium]